MFCATCGTLTSCRSNISNFFSWLNLGKHVNEMFKVENLIIFCNLPLISMGEKHFGVLVMTCANDVDSKNHY